ncbi:MAG: S8 family peptidase [bacterium]|nr:S8 family peptidase [bacterium]
MLDHVAQFYLTIDMINCSFGFPHNNKGKRRINNKEKASYNFPTAHVIVCSAGNSSRFPMYPVVENEDCFREDGFIRPETYQTTLFVGGIDITFLKFSSENGDSWSPHLYSVPGDDPVFQNHYIVAPATNVSSLCFDEKMLKIKRITNTKGSSCSAPLVTQCVALMLEAYNNALIRLYEKNNASTPWIESLKSIDVHEQNDIEKWNYDMALAYIFNALTTDAIIPEEQLSDLSGMVRDDALLEDFKQRRSRFVTKVMFDGARKHHLLDPDILFDPEIYGQGVVDVYKSYEILQGLFDNDDAIAHLQTYETDPLSEDEYDAFMQRQKDRIQEWDNMYLKRGYKYYESEKEF